MAIKEFNIKINGVEIGIVEIAALKKEADRLDYVFDDLSKSMDTFTNYSKGLFNLLKAGTGIVSLFGGESEKTKKIMENIGKVLTIVNSLQEVNNLLIKNAAGLETLRAVQTKAAAIAIALAEKNTRLATIAQKAFNLVAKANPYVLLALGIGGMVTALASFISSTDEATEEQKKLNKQLEEFNELTQKTASNLAPTMAAYSKLGTQWKALGGDLKAQEKFIINNKNEFKKLGKEVNNVADAEAFLGSDTQNVIDAFRLRAEAAAKYEIAVQKIKEAILKQAEIEKKQAEIDSMPDTINSWYRGTVRNQKKSDSKDELKKDKEELEKFKKNNNELLKESVTAQAQADRLLPPIYEESRRQKNDHYFKSLKDQKTFADLTLEQEKQLRDNLRNLIDLNERETQVVIDEWHQERENKERETAKRIADEKKKALDVNKAQLDTQKGQLSRFYADVSALQVDLTKKKHGLIDVEATQENIDKVNSKLTKYQRDIESLKKATSDYYTKALENVEKDSVEYIRLLEAKTQAEYEYAEKSKEISKIIQSNNKVATDAQKNYFQELHARMEQYSKNIMEGVNAVFSATKDLFNDQLKDAKEKLSEITTQYDEVVKKRKESDDKIQSLEEEAKKAKGGRALVLQEQIRQEMGANQQLANQEKALAKDKEKQEKAVTKKEKQIKRTELAQNIVQGIANTALGATKAWSYGPILGPILAAVVAAAGAVQIGIMTKQLAKLEDGGLLNGKRHSQGGMRIEGSNIEVEGGEYVVNRESTSKNLGLVRYINSERRELKPTDIESFFASSSRGFEPSFNRMMENGGQLPIAEPTANIDNETLVQAIRSIRIEPRVAVSDIHRVQDSMASVDSWTGV